MNEEQVLKELKSINSAGYLFIKRLTRFHVKYVEQTIALRDLSLGSPEIQEELRKLGGIADNISS